MIYEEFVVSVLILTVFANVILWLLMMIYYNFLIEGNYNHFSNFSKYCIVYPLRSIIIAAIFFGFYIWKLIIFKPNVTLYTYKGLNKDNKEVYTYYNMLHTDSATVEVNKKEIYNVPVKEITTDDDLRHYYFFILKCPDGHEEKDYLKYDGELTQDKKKKYMKRIYTIEKSYYPDITYTIKKYHYPKEKK